MKFLVLTAAPARLVFWQKIPRAVLLSVSWL